MVRHRKLLESFYFASQGIWHAFTQNQNLRIHFFIAIIVAIFAVVFRLDGFEMGILGIAILLVIAAEMINTSIEEMVDLITIEHRKEAKIAKDVAAGMVLVASIGSVIIGILVFAPHLFRIFK